MSSVRITWTSPLWKNLKLYMKSSFRVHTNFMTLIKCSVWFVLHYVAPQLARPLLLPTVARSQIHMNSLHHYHRAENSSRVPPMSKPAHQRDTSPGTLHYCSLELCCPLLACANTATTSGFTHHVMLDVGELKTLQCMTTPFPSTAMYWRLSSVKITGCMSGERVISVAPLKTGFD